MCKLERPCEDTVTRWLSTGQEERSHQQPNPARLNLGLFSLQNYKQINFCCLIHLACGILWQLTLIYYLKCNAGHPAPESSTVLVKNADSWNPLQTYKEKKLEKKGKRERKEKKKREKKISLGMGLWTIHLGSPKAIPKVDRCFWTGYSCEWLLATLCPSIVGSPPAPILPLHPPHMEEPCPGRAPAHPDLPPVKCSDELSALSARKHTLGKSKMVYHVAVISNQRKKSWAKMHTSPLH